MTLEDALITLKISDWAAYNRLLIVDYFGKTYHDFKDFERDAYTLKTYEPFHILDFINRQEGIDIMNWKVIDIDKRRVEFTHSKLDNTLKEYYYRIIVKPNSSIPK